MFRHPAFAFMICLALWVASVTVCIELQNVAAGNYLPRKDVEGGKWRISRDNSPRDELRGMVESIGLLQYLLAPLLFVLAFVQVIGKGSLLHRRIAGVCGAISLLAMYFVLYRGYLPSLGW